MKMKVRKAIFPAAGLARVFSPLPSPAQRNAATGRQAIIQYGVEEALAAGCDQIIIITGAARARSKTISTSATNSRNARGERQDDLLKIVRQISDMIT